MPSAMSRARRVMRCVGLDGNGFAQTIIKIACLRFDNLSDVRYTDEDIARMSRQQQH